MTTWNDRLKEAMRKDNITASDLVRATGISAAGIKKWIDGITLAPKYTDVISACKALNVSPEWLMDGVIATDTISATVEDQNAISLDMVDVKASCGTGVANWNDVPCVRRIQVSKAWFEYHFPYAHQENIKVITALGDSMEPLVKDGDAVFIDIKDAEFIREGVYAVIVDGELFIKRIQRLPGKCLRFKSENPSYDPFDIAADSNIEVRIIGRVIKAMKIVPV